MMQISMNWILKSHTAPLPSQLYDLMTMAFKYQVLLCPRPKDILLISFNHMDAIRDFVKDASSILNQVDETYQELIEVLSMKCKAESQTDLSTDHWCLDVP